MTNGQALRWLWNLLGVIKPPVHGTDECQPLQRRPSAQSVVVMVCENVSYCLGQSHRKEPISIVLIPFFQVFPIIEFEQG